MVFRYAACRMAHMEKKMMRVTEMRVKAYFQEEIGFFCSAAI